MRIGGRSLGNLKLSFVLCLAIALGGVAAMPAARAAGEATADDTARYLAGLAPSEGSPLAAAAKDRAWQDNARYFDAAWKDLDARQLSKIRSWASANLSRPKPVLYYMFSGPDFLYANAFFGSASTYVLSGLEPVGDIPNLMALPQKSLPSELASIRASLSTILSYSFFITKDMRVRLSSHRLTGTVPLLYVFLARSGKTIREVSLIAIDKDGGVHSRDEAGLPNDVQKGVKIVFSSGQDQDGTLYYVQTDLSDTGTKSSGFLKFCEPLGQGDSLIKSASYLLHADSFSTVRGFLLKQTSSLVQDDTGIPVSYFDKAAWQLQPFGRYLGPISIFRGRNQPLLSELFRKSKPAVLPFGIGYRNHPNESNILLATRNVAQAASNP